MSKIKQKSRNFLPIRNVFTWIWLPALHRNLNRRRTIYIIISTLWVANPCGNVGLLYRYIATLKIYQIYLLFAAWKICNTALDCEQILLLTNCKLLCHWQVTVSKVYRPGSQQEGAEPISNSHLVRSSVPPLWRPGSLHFGGTGYQYLQLI